MFKRIDHVELVPSNLEKSLRFYTEILGFKVQTRRKVDNPPLEELVFIELGGSVIEMFGVRETTPASQEPWRIGCRKFALAVEDMEKTIEHLKSHGVELSQRLVVTDTMKRTEIKDPDGLSIELIERL